MSKVYLAVDLGAGSGRVIAAIYDADQIRLDELNRFETLSKEVNGSCFWDIQAIFKSILEGLSLGAEKYGNAIQSVAVDSWGVDYGLLDKDGKLIEDPHQYRDSRTDGIEEKITEVVDRKTIYQESGIAFMFFNTLYQLYSAVLKKDKTLDKADSLLFMPDLIAYFLSGAKVSERTIASTSQMLNPNTGKWSETILSKLGIPSDVLCDIVEPGTIRDALLPDIRKKTGLGDVKVISVGGHDTASAVAAVPGASEKRAYLSSGTWSLMGIESDKPFLGDEALRGNFTNEVGVSGRVRFLKNICGMWLIQQCKEYWASEGNDLTYAEIVKLAEDSEQISSVINPDDPLFVTAGDMPKRIQDYCSQSGQQAPETKGEILRVAFESLAAKYRIVFDDLGEISQYQLDHLHIVGGGCQNDYLNQCTADALGVPVLAGPVEATSLGNAITQMLALGDISDIDEGRNIISKSVEIKKYLPVSNSYLENLVDKLKEIINKETVTL